MCGTVNLDDDDDYSVTSNEKRCATWCCPCYWSIVCAVVGCLCLCMLCDEVKKLKSEKPYELRQFKLRQAMAPKPLPRRRKRTLTLPLQPPSGLLARLKTPQQTYGQAKCPLFKLPAELRLKIWEDVLGGKVVHVGCKHNRLQHTVCRECDVDDIMCGPAVTCFPLYPYPGTTYTAWAAPQQHGILPLAKTCRRIYSETIDMAYRLNAFSFNDLYCVSWFTKTITPARLDAVRVLRIYWNLEEKLHRELKVKVKYQEEWKVLCQTFIKMKSLKELTIRFGGNVTLDWRPERRPFDLRPLRLIPGLDVLRVYVPWIPGQHGEYAPSWMIHLMEWPWRF